MQGDTLRSLFTKLQKKAGEESIGYMVGAGWVKYEWNGSFWDLDDGQLDTRRFYVTEFETLKRGDTQMRTTRSSLGGMHLPLRTLRHRPYSFTIPRNHYLNPLPIRIRLTMHSAPSRLRSCQVKPRPRRVNLPALYETGNRKAAYAPSGLDDPDGLVGVSLQRMTESLNINGILSISILRTEAGSSLEPLAPSPEVGRPS